MKNTCTPFNSQIFIDMAIILQNNKFVVTGLTRKFRAINLGTFEHLLDAYSLCCEHGFDVREYEIPISPFQNKTVAIDFN